MQERGEIMSDTEEKTKKNKKIARMSLKEVLLRMKEMEDQGHRYSTYYRHLTIRADYLKSEYIRKEAQKALS